MNCYYHPEQPAVTICPFCGKGLCTPCANASTICNSCRQKKTQKSVITALRYLIILSILGIIGYNWDFLGSDTRSENGLSAYFLMAACTGIYMLLGKLNFTYATIFIYDSATYGFFQLIALIFKIVICFAFGLIATPIIIIWQLIILIRNLLKLYQMKQEV